MASIFKGESPQIEITREPRLSLRHPFLAVYKFFRSMVKIFIKDLAVPAFKFEQVPALSPNVRLV